MKRIASILLILCMIFALGACKNESSGAEEQTTLSLENVGLADYLDACAAQGKCNWNDFTAEEQMAISQKAIDTQVTLAVSDSGVIKIVDISGIVIEYGGSWPGDNSLVKDFPVPSNKIAYTYTLSGVMCQIALHATFDEAKAYAKNLSDLGFTAEVIETENEGVYWYSAENSENQSGAVVYEDGIMIISVMPAEMN